MHDLHGILTVAVIALVTVAIRFLPCALLRGRQTPKFVSSLGMVLPYSIMGMLVIYCLRGISFASVATFLPEILACAAVVLIHILKRNTLLSILVGTILYMVLVQVVF